MKYANAAFQCSSASRKFLNAAARRVHRIGVVCFSALQRAENSSIVLERVAHSVRGVFQCSSASRKFLNRTPDKMTAFYEAEFQCSSASRKFLNVEGARDAAGNRRRFSALQRAENSSIWNRDNAHPENNGFSALQRAENSSIVLERVAQNVRGVFQCSSASRKFLNFT